MTHTSASTSSHKVWHFRSDITTDDLAPGHTMKHGIAVTAAHCLEAVNLQFASAVRAGDVLVALDNFGIGSSREQAPQALVHLGVKCVIAKSYSGLFFRNAFNLGLLLLTCSRTEELAECESLSINWQDLSITSPDKPTLRLACEPIPDFLMAMANAGGLLAQLKQKFSTS